MSLGCCCYCYCRVLPVMNLSAVTSPSLMTTDVQLSTSDQSFQPRALDHPACLSARPTGWTNSITTQLVYIKSSTRLDHPACLSAHPPGWTTQLVYISSSNGLDKQHHHPACLSDHPPGWTTQLVYQLVQRAGQTASPPSLSI